MNEMKTKTMHLNFRRFNDKSNFLNNVYHDHIINNTFCIQESIAAKTSIMFILFDRKDVK